MTEPGPQSVREQIAAALSQLDGVTGYPTKPVTPVKGAAWPMWVSAGRYTACALLDTWWVWLVVASGDESTTSLDADALVWPLWEVLDEFAEVSIVEGLTLTFGPSGTQQLPALRAIITTTRDKEEQ